MSRLSQDVRRSIRAEARHFVNHGSGLNFPEMLRRALADDPRLRAWAWADDTERAVARRDVWAKEVGAIFSESVKAAFREAERVVAEERRAAVQFEDDARRAAEEGVAS